MAHSRLCVFYHSFSQKRCLAHWRRASCLSEFHCPLGKSWFLLSGEVVREADKMAALLGFQVRRAGRPCSVTSSNTCLNFFSVISSVPLADPLLLIEFVSFSVTMGTVPGPEDDVGGPASVLWMAQERALSSGSALWLSSFSTVLRQKHLLKDTLT